MERLTLSLRAGSPVDTGTQVSLALHPEEGSSVFFRCGDILLSRGAIKRQVRFWIEPERESRKNLDSDLGAAINLQCDFGKSFDLSGSHFFFCASCRVGKRQSRRTHLVLTFLHINFLHTLWQQEFWSGP
jgi:hypothetical protein